MTMVALAALAFVPMLLEAAVSARNTRALLAAGAVEPRRDVFRIMQVAYPACFAAMLVESAVRGDPTRTAVAAGCVLFVAAKALKYWAIATLGRRWSFRVLVPPGSALVTRGPYRMLRHPNYIAVAGELASVALVADAPVTGVCAVVGFGMLMRARIAVEEDALGES